MVLSYFKMSNHVMRGRYYLCSEGLAQQTLKNSQNWTWLNKASLGKKDSNLFILMAKLKYKGGLDLIKIVKIH